jgi:hypothetical protein
LAVPRIVCHQVAVHSLPPPPPLLLDDFFPQGHAASHLIQQPARPFFLSIKSTYHFDIIAR